MDTDAEDHAYDALRYGLMAENHRFAGVPKPPETHLEFVHLGQAVRQFVNGIKTMRPYAGASWHWRLGPFIHWAPGYHFEAAGLALGPLWVGVRIPTDDARGAGAPERQLRAEVRYDLEAEIDTDNEGAAWLSFSRRPTITRYRMALEMIRSWSSSSSTSRVSWQGGSDVPPKSEKQRRFMGAELERKRSGQGTQTGMSEKQLREFAARPVKTSKGKRGKVKRPIYQAKGEDLPDEREWSPQRAEDKYRELEAFWHDRKEDDIVRMKQYRGEDLTEAPAPKTARI